jgi:hypothetical protein
MKVVIKASHLLDTERGDNIELNVDLRNATLPQAMTTLIDLLKFMGYQEWNIKGACEEYAANGEIYID